MDEENVLVLDDVASVSFFFQIHIKNWNILCTSHTYKGNKTCKRYLFFRISTYFFEKQGKRKGPSIPWFPPQMAVSGARPKQNPGIPSWLPTWVAWTQAFGASSAASIDTWTESWTGNRSAGNWTSSLLWDASVTGDVVACHASTSPVIKHFSLLGAVKYNILALVPFLMVLITLLQCYSMVYSRWVKINHILNTLITKKYIFKCNCCCWNLWELLLKASSV